MNLGGDPRAGAAVSVHGATTIYAHRSWGRLALIAGVVLYLGAILVVPLAALVVEAVRTGVADIVRELASDEAIFALKQSFILAGIAVVVNGVLGVAGAIALVRHRFFGRLAIDALVDLTLAVSPVMTGLAFLLLVGRGGWLAPTIERFDLRVAFAFPGLVICTLFVTLPFTIREVGHVLEELGTDEEQVAATLGAAPWQTFWRVTLPNVRRALSLGITLTAARALGEFGAVLVVGGAISGHTQTATTFIYAASEERRDAATFGMAIVLAIACAVLLALLETLKRAQTRTTSP